MTLKCNRVVEVVKVRVWVQNCSKLSAAVRDLSWSQRKENSDEHNAVRRYRADSKDTSDQDRGEWSVHCVRPVSLDIWRVERCVCSWPSWLSRRNQFMHSDRVHCSTRVHQSATLNHALGRCFLFPESFSLKCPVLPCCSLSSKIPPVG